MSDHDEQRRIVLAGTRYRTAAIGTLQKAARQLTEAGDHGAALRALLLTRDVLDDQTSRYRRVLAANPPEPIAPQPPSGEPAGGEVTRVSGGSEGGR